MKQIYLDYNASTPIDPQVVQSMQTYFHSHYGNPSSGHWASLQASEALLEARAQVAALIGCHHEEIVFTSGGSEANNHVLKGVYFAQENRSAHIITTKIEHPAIIEPCHFLESLGCKVTYLDVDRTGRVSPEQLEKSLTKDTILVSVMLANNEVGTIQPLQEIAAITRRHQILLHTDASQSLGKMEIDVHQLGVDFLTIAGHKLYAPKGVGALFIRKGTSVVPLIHGAGHEQGRRAGTENVLLDVALGKACQLAEIDLQAGGQDVLRAIRDSFWKGLKRLLGDQVRLNGYDLFCLPNTLHVSFMNRIGQDVLALIPEVAASTGSACHAGQVQLSSVLEAMGYSKEDGQGAVRFSLGRMTREQDIQDVLQLLRDRL